jgi:hypothetical protein
LSALKGSVVVKDELIVIAIAFPLGGGVPDLQARECWSGGNMISKTIATEN